MFLSYPFPADAFIGGSGRARLQSKLFAVLQHRPGQPGILRGNGDHRLPVTATFLQATRPATEAVLLVAQTRQDGAGTHDQKTSQIGVAGLGDPSQSGFAAAAVLARRQAHPGRHLASVLEVVPAADTGQERTGADRANARAFHQALAARIVPGGLGDDAVVLLDPGIEPIGVGQQVADALVGVARQVFEMRADLTTQAGDFLRQDDAEFADQAAQPVIGRGAFFDKAIPGAVQAQDDLLVFFLDRDEAHVRSGDGFANRGGVRRIILAALAGHAVGGDELRRHQLHAVAVLAEQPRPVVRARAGFHADEAGRQLRHQLQQFVASYLRLH